MESPLCPTGTRLIETLKWDGRLFLRADRHLARLAASAARLGFACDLADVRSALAKARSIEPARVRLTLGQTGDVEVTSAPLAATANLWRVMLSADRVCSADPFLGHKTTERALYERTRAALPDRIDEAIFANERDEISEGTITTVFFDLGRGLRTPPTNSGCLPGVLRAELLDSGACREEVLALADLPEAKLWIGNSLRGLIPARLSAGPPASAG